MEVEKNESSNCTFMELKYYGFQCLIEALERSNCTFMELKYTDKAIIMNKMEVLIVPLWN